MHTSLSLHKNHLGLGSSPVICWKQSDVAQSNYFSEHLSDWSGNSFSSTPNSSPPEQRKRKAEVSSPVHCPKKRRVVLAKSESPLTEGSLKSSQKSAPFQSKSPLITGSLKSSTTSASMNECGDRHYLSTVPLVYVSDGFTALYQEHHKVILDHI